MDTSGSLKKALKQLSNMEPDELFPSGLSFLMAFILMAAYYILRPFRDALASDWTDAEVSFLWTLNFFVSTASVALFGWIVSKVRFKHLVPGVYTVFSLSFVLIFISIRMFPDENILIEKGFYLWVSVFSLFNISVFWSFMADVYTKDQSKRLFALIGAGASLGAVFGPAIPTLFAGTLGVDHLLLLSGFFLTPAIFISMSLPKILRKQNGSKEPPIIGGNPFKGFLDFLTQPYLFGIGLFIVFYTAISTFVYFEQKNILEPFTLVDRTRILGLVDWVVNISSFLIAFFATGRVVQFFGMPFTLSIIPLVMSLGLFILAWIPKAIWVLSLQVVRRAGNYGMTRPAREMLFTLVSREERFKAKPVIDIVLYRGGDMVTSWGFSALTEGLKLGLGAVALVGSGLALTWGAIGYFLGKRFESRAK